ncbi:MAG: lysine--tRNA ligase [Edaphobacter sp.]
MYESEFEKNLYQQRRDKLQQIAALGHAVYPNSYSFSHTIPELRAAYDCLTSEQLECSPTPITVSIAGRIMAIRVQGKAGFAQIQQGGQRFQIYVRKDDVGDELFALYKLLDLGDHIGVRGHLFRTKTGELTVHVGSVDGRPALTFLAKAMLALPDKYHGLEDTELRYRQRYVDLFMNTGSTKPPAAPNKPATGTEAAPADAAVPCPPAESATTTESSDSETPNVREVFVKRAAVLRAIRRFFDARGYLEVETPMMHQVAGGAAAQPFTTHHNALDMDLFLRIAPELYLKRLVVGGLDRVYEINRNFRNEGISTKHNPEFTMLEFYQAYANYHDLMKLTEELIIFVAKEVNGNTSVRIPMRGLADPDLSVEIDLSRWKRLSMRQAISEFWPKELTTKPDNHTFDSYDTFVSFLDAAFREEFNFDPKGPFASNEAGREFGNAIRNAKADLPSDRSYPGKAISTLFEGLAEQHLIWPTTIYDFPLAVSPLSKKKPDEPDWVERFEFYIGGFEVGNAFSELNDPDDQRARFEAQMTEKNRGDKEAMDMDEDYVRALGYGLPPTAGEGIGIDRLTMLLTDSKSIRDVILFPLMRPQQRSAEQVAAKEAEPHGESVE